MEDTLNEEQCIRNQKEQKLADQQKALRDLDALPKPISTTALFDATYQLIEAHTKRDMFLKRVSRFSQPIESGTTYTEDSIHETLTEQPTFNVLIKDVFVHKGSLNVYETYFHNFVLPQAFSIKSSYNLTT